MDVYHLVHHYLDKYNQKNSDSVEISQDALDVLTRYRWPGNVRELKHVVELVILLSLEDGEGNVIQPRHLPEELTGDNGYVSVEKEHGWSIRIQDDIPVYKEFKLICEHAYISRLLAEFNGNKQKVARAMGVSPSVLYTKLHALGLFEKKNTEDS